MAAMNHEEVESAQDQRDRLYELRKMHLQAVNQEQQHILHTVAFRPGSMSITIAREFSRNGKRALAMLATNNILVEALDKLLSALLKM